MGVTPMAVSAVASEVSCMTIDVLPPRDRQGRLHVVVESPRGSQVKLKFAPELGAFTLSRALSLGVNYPYDWGFIPGTRAPDGDPLDAMVLLDVPTYPGVVLVCEPIGVLEVEQRRAEHGGVARNDCILATPAGAPRLTTRDARDLPARTREEIELFFQTAVALECKDLTLLGWGGPSAASKLIAQAIMNKQSRAA
jgi:inorganic pyrophosphatase